MNWVYITINIQEIISNLLGRTFWLIISTWSFYKLTTWYLLYIPVDRSDSKNRRLIHFPHFYFLCFLFFSNVFITNKPSHKLHSISHIHRRHSRSCLFLHLTIHLLSYKSLCDHFFHVIISRLVHIPHQIHQSSRGIIVLGSRSHRFVFGLQLQPVLWM